MIRYRQITGKLGKPQKVPPLVARPLRKGKGGGVNCEGRATIEKRLFLKLFFILFCSQSIIIDIKTTYKKMVNFVVGWQSRRFLTGFCTIFF